MLTLSNEAAKELNQIADTHATAAKQSTKEAWKWYNQGKADGINMVRNMMSEVDDDDYHDSRDPANVFSELHVGIEYTIYVKECDVNAFVGILINNHFRAVVEDIDNGMWKLSIWKG